MVDLIKECQDCGLIGITGHANPDGDCVGSTMALWQFLKKALPSAAVEVLLEKPAPIFDFIEGVDQIVTAYEKAKTYDVMFVVDSVPERVGEAQKYVKTAKKIINIDHHISNKGRADVNVIDASASSAAEVVYELIAAKAEYKALMDREMAQTLYIGIIHDSGVMQYSNTSPRTLRIVADLISYGFDFPRLIDETFYEKTYIQSQIMGRAILEAFPMLGGKLLVSMVDRKTMEFYGADKKDLSGIVNQLRIVKGVQVAMFLYETGTLEYKVSLRSSNAVDVAAVASYFGGGGHQRASGCTLNGSFYDVVNNVAAQIALQIEENGE